MEAVLMIVVIGIFILIFGLYADSKGQSKANKAVGLGSTPTIEYFTVKK